MSTFSPPATESPAAIDYAKLSRMQKLALFLIVIGPEAAAEILRSFDDGQIELLCREMGGFPMVPDAVRRQVLEEVSPLIGESVASSLGGLEFAKRAVEKVKGDHRATSILGRAGMSDGAASADALRDFGEMEGRQIFNLLRAEHPQTIAFVLSHLTSAKAAEVFGILAPEVREEVIERLGTIDRTSTALVGKIVRSLGRHFESGPRPTLQASGGVRAVADLLNGLDRATSKTVLARLEERNASLGAAVRRRLFSFEDLTRLTAADLQRVMREVDSSNLALSLKGASEPLKEKVFAAISKRAAESLRDEIGMLGAVRRKEVDAAQDAVIQVVRRLEEEGAVTLDADAAQTLS
jgi:flagellar motor switch protein FliG